MMQTVAAIDLGSHTARLLIARKSDLSTPFITLARERAYIRIAEDFDRHGERVIKPGAFARTLKVMHGFSRRTAGFNVRQVHAVATGVVRDAVNRDQFLNHIYDHTGIIVRPISGEREGLLGTKGVLHALNIGEGLFLIFDLGGGTTEFCLGARGRTEVKSIPLGAVVLSKEHIKTDPPEEAEIRALFRHIGECLKDVDLDVSTEHIIVGTGGTVTTLAAVIHRLPSDEIAPERVNGLILTLPQLKACFEAMRHLSLEQRIRRYGMDPERADVILAGSIVVMSILRFLGVYELAVSMSDILEGILTEC